MTAQTAWQHGSALEVWQADSEGTQAAGQQQAGRVGTRQRCMQLRGSARYHHAFSGGTCWGCAMSWMASWVITSCGWGVRVQEVLGLGMERRLADQVPELRRNQHNRGARVDKACFSQPGAPVGSSWAGTDCSPHAPPGTPSQQVSGALVSIQTA